MDSTTEDAEPDVEAGPDLPRCFEGDTLPFIAPVVVNGWLPPFPMRRPQIVVSFEDEEVAFDGGARDPIESTYKKLTLRGNNGEIGDVIIRFPVAFADDEVVYPTPGQEVYATGVSCAGGDYTVLENGAGELILEGGGETCRCAGDTTGFEAICQPTRRFALNREASPELLPQCVSYEHWIPRCSHVLTSYPATLRTDEGVLDLPVGAVVDATIEQRPYKAIRTFGGFFTCPCADDCGGFYSSFMVLPAAP